ncbi:MAG: VOC family protein [Deltaproteobacteria bacterium]|nr:VOC family protein [Deltaproteobacteria bacterium]
MQKIGPFLWFDKEAEEAAHFYVSVFSEAGQDAKILNITRYPKAAEKVSGKSAGSVMTVDFELDAQRFVALNGGPIFKFSPAISFLVNCKTQEEVDQLWKKLSAVPEAEQCGWLQDKYGVSWQIVPTVLNEMLRDADAKKSEKVMAALLQMKKIDVEALKRAYTQG